MIHNFCINDFEGPLDLLLHLIRINEMDIYEINIESITKQYLEFINLEENKLSVDDTSEYLVMAAELIHLKSKLLIKQDVEEEESEYEFQTTNDLIDRLVEYETVKELTSSFKELEDKRSEFYTKLPSDLSEFKEESTLVGGEVELSDLVNAFELFLQRQKLSKPLNTKITKRELSVGERRQQIRSILKINKKCEFTSLFEEVTKPYVVVTFLTILEMSKNDEISITQEGAFGNIYIEAK